MRFLGHLPSLSVSTLLMLGQARARNEAVRKSDPRILQPSEIRGLNDDTETGLTIMHLNVEEPPQTRQSPYRTEKQNAFLVRLANSLAERRRRRQRRRRKRARDESTPEVSVSSNSKSGKKSSKYSKSAKSGKKEKNRRRKPSREGDVTTTPPTVAPFYTGKVPTASPYEGVTKPPTLSPRVTVQPIPIETSSPTTQVKEETNEPTPTPPVQTSAPTQSNPAQTATPTDPITTTGAPTTTPTSSPTVPQDGFQTTLDLSEVAERYQQAFVDAAVRWDSVIIGDLEDVAFDQELRDDSECTNLPADVDDLFICARIFPIDGEGGVLGFAGPEYARFGDKVIPSVGNMQFDTEDVDALIVKGTFSSVILHEMGHVYGIGTLWDQNGLIGTEDDGCPYKAGTAATFEYQSLSGCTTTVPIETEGGAGTACVHWDEECLLGELMTGFATDGLELSRITIAGLEDLGYDVDYSQADPFLASQLDPSCVCNAGLKGSTQPFKFGGENTTTSFVSQLGEGTRHGSSGTRRRLSAEGRQKAIDFGVQHLRSKQNAQSPYFVGGIMSVLYVEGDEIYSVEVSLPKQNVGNIFSSMGRENDND